MVVLVPDNIRDIVFCTGILEGLDYFESTPDISGGDIILGGYIMKFHSFEVDINIEDLDIDGSCGALLWSHYFCWKLWQHKRLSFPVSMGRDVFTQLRLILNKPII